MPLTFLSHQAPVLPLKMLAPRWFDGTALVIGSMAPDLVFLTHGTEWYVDAHTLAPQVWLCLPLTLALTWVVKRHIAGPLAAHLPDGGAFHLRDYGRLTARPLRTRRFGWLILAVSALVGSLSHLVFDSFTHGFGWAVQHLDPLQRQAFALPSALGDRPVYVHDLLQVAGTLLGGTFAVWNLRLIGGRRLLRDWYPTARLLEATNRSRRSLVGGTGAGLIAGLALAAATAHVGGAQDLMIRVADLTFCGLTIGCVGARRHMTGADRRGW